MGGAPTTVPEQASLDSAPLGAYDRHMMGLAFLAPDLQKLILEGRQPTVFKLHDIFGAGIPPAWGDQRWMFAALG